MGGGGGVRADKSHQLTVHVCLRPGTLCEVDINECLEPVPHVCQNGATCQDASNAYTCLCTPGWEGVLCQQVRCQTCPKAIYLSLHTWLGGSSVSKGKVSNLPKSYIPVSAHLAGREFCVNR